EIDKTILLICHPSLGILMRKRSEKLLHGMWEFYHIDNMLEAKDVSDRIQKLGYTPTQLIPLGEATHRFTHLKWNMVGYMCRVEESFSIMDYDFVPMEEIGDLAIPSAFGRFVGDIGREIII
ncbi:MAG: NUDIX domain-containing protein, partial [Oscillospiraceae bacterium]|nr:NUDIX domain-containing protein [Oscillospiraceae bacterium]